MGSPVSGDVLCDPLCGGGSIPIEAALEMKDVVVLAGDNHEKAVDRTLENVAAVSSKFGTLMLL